MEEKIWLRIVKSEVVAYGDEETLNKAANGRFDMVLTAEEWKRHGCTARIEDDRIVLGDPELVAYERNSETIRNERYLRLRQCDKVSPMRWNAMTEAQRQAWTDYRQALLDIPQQAGFPWGGDVEAVPWPVKPE